MRGLNEPSDGSGVKKLLTLMILYYPAIGGWLGNDRYILPNILPYSIYWALALTSLLACWRSRRNRPESAVTGP